MHLQKISLINSIDLDGLVEYSSYEAYQVHNVKAALSEKLFINGKVYGVWFTQEKIYSVRITYSKCYGIHYKTE